ncbi:MAG TPA: polyprenyl synthetase family protein [Opitutus sp.]|nr:polyprenyl synthetase family protein [Opitutus sp.]
MTLPDDVSFEQALVRHAPPLSGVVSPLREALALAVGRTGRMVRASLVLESAAASGMPAAAAEQVACAVEYWHLASLLFDDLPCMDDADERRGGLCLHRSFGEATAILAALALINRAYALVGEAFATRPLAVRRRATALVDAALGPAGLIGGQARDLAFAPETSSPRDIGRIAWQKTGTLLWLCVALPALWARPGRGAQRALRRLCVYWGLAYQAVDDLRDVLATSIATGKTVQRDAALRRPNLALALGVPAARRRVERLLSQAGRTVTALARRDGRRAFLARWHEDVFVARGAMLRAA